MAPGPGPEDFSNSCSSRISNFTENLWFRKARNSSEEAEFSNNLMEATQPKLACVNSTVINEKESLLDIERFSSYDKAIYALTYVMFFVGILLAKVKNLEKPSLFQTRQSAVKYFLQNV